MSMNDAVHTNSLIHETSPYLLQHAHNPVDWHAWNDTTLALARSENKPILLSIGYSACHWCHVMAHESFEDPETAALMNRIFVNIKVDREERPDLDRAYQLAHQVLTQRGGGWPLTVFLTPDDLTPFFAGTYFPREPRYGMPDFKQMLTRVSAFYHEHPDELHKQNAELRSVFRRIEKQTTAPATTLNDAPLHAAFRVFAESFDPHFGGFGHAPKFPHSTGLEFLLRCAADPKSNAENAHHSRHMLDVTLSCMADGGICDQLGGGFYRYSTDEQWMIPHFEKMLYDNGLLLALYAKAAALTGSSRYAQVARETANWVMRDMQSPQGGYYSSLDADSEGREGKYYVWDKQEIRALLSAEEFAAFAPRYGLDAPPNFGERWHPHRVAGPGTTNPLSDLEPLLKPARQKLLAARQKRIRPGLDDKVLTAWNGLMISGMALAGRLLNEPGFVESARRAVDFIRTKLWKDHGLLAVWREGQAKFPAYLDDYAFLLKGTLELVQADWNSELFDFANQIADQMITRFEDRQHGGFWFTGDGSETPLYRSKTFTDESLPAGNATAALALLQLGHLRAEPRYLDAAERSLKAALPAMQANPDAHAAMLLALQDALEPPPMTVLRGKPEQLGEWRRALDQHFNPQRIILAIPDTASHLTGLLAQCTVRGEVCAYQCRGTQCSLPLTRLDDLLGN